MNSLIAIASIVLLLALGIGKIIYSAVRIQERIDFLTDYHNKLVAFLENPEDHPAHIWLVEHMDEAQEKLGGAGIIDGYRPPYANYMLTNYQILINLIPKLHDPHAIEPGEVTFTTDAFVRAAGLCKALQADYRKQFKRPLQWLTTGISLLLSLPLYILRELNVLSLRTYRKITSSSGFKKISGLLALVGTLETLSTIFLNKSATVELAHKIIELTSK